MTEQPQHNQAYHNMLMELIRLRETDYDAFLDKLYEALTGDFKDSIDKDAPLVKKETALNIMIQHFELKEEYEKCANLLKMVKELKPVK